MKIGDKVKRKITYGAEGGSLLDPMEGTVVYVHPKRLFYTVEFSFEARGGMATFRESYPLRSKQVVETAEDDLRPKSFGARLPGHVRFPSYRANYLEADQAKNKKKGKKPK